MKKFIVLVAIFISGCATTHKTSQALVDNPKTFKHVIPVEMNYQKAYKILAEKSRECLQRSSIGNQMRTEENLDDKKQIGEIRVMNTNAYWGLDYLGYYVIAADGKEKSVLTTYHPNGVMGSMGDNSEMIQSWLEGNTSCNFVERAKK